MYSIGQLAKKFKLSRTTLLYYDSIGLLNPASRSKSGYRLYHEDAVKRLEQINLFREMGVTLEEIKGLLSDNDTGVASILVKQLGELNLEIEKIRRRQAKVLQFLRKTKLLYQAFVSKTGQELEEIFHQAGVNRETSNLWHANFEKASPEEHRQFLHILGFSAEEQIEIVQLAKEVMVREEQSEKE